MRRPVACLYLALAFVSVAGLACSTRAPTVEEFVKALERNAYDEIAHVFSEFCARTSSGGPFIDHTRIELSREIRQNGSNGPSPPTTPTGEIANDAGSQRLIDPNTGFGHGPVVVVYCAADEVPPAVWRRLDRYWKD